MSHIASQGSPQKSDRVRHSRKPKILVCAGIKPAASRKGSASIIYLESKGAMSASIRGSIRNVGGAERPWLKAGPP